MSGTKLAQTPEHPGMEIRYEVKDLSLDMVDLDAIGEPRPIVLDRALTELREGRLDL